jgi:hypothetical protein
MHWHISVLFPMVRWIRGLLPSKELSSKGRLKMERIALVDSQLLLVHFMCVACYNYESDPDVCWWSMVKSHFSWLKSAAFSGFCSPSLSQVAKPCLSAPLRSPCWKIFALGVGPTGLPCPKPKDGGVHHAKIGREPKLFFMAVEPTKHGVEWPFDDNQKFS